MVKLNALLSERFKKKEKSSEKLNALAERTGSGELSSFGGVFKVGVISDHEREHLSNILETYKETDSNLQEDLNQLCKLTQEVKAISNQAVILHGERIQKAQQLLKSYRDGAFTEWMISSYGNRQTPYNFLQYYDFYTSLSGILRKKTDEMPRQVIYTLASRTGEQKKKEEIIQQYNGESKETLLNLIRDKFPLVRTDKRQSRPAKRIISVLKKGIAEAKGALEPTPREKDKIRALIQQLQALVE